MMKCFFVATHIKLFSLFFPFFFFFLVFPFFLTDISWHSKQLVNTVLGSEPSVEPLVINHFSSILKERILVPPLVSSHGWFWA